MTKTTDKIDTLQASNRAAIAQLKEESAQLLVDIKASASKSVADLNTLKKPSPTRTLPTWVLILSSIALGLGLGFAIWGLS